MSEKNQITGKQIAAGRVLAGIGRAELAATAAISIPALRRMEASAGPASGMKSKVEAVCRALEASGVQFIPENGGGVGVRLKFTAQMVKRIDVFENEGGPAGEDDVR